MYPRNQKPVCWNIKMNSTSGGGVEQCPLLWRVWGWAMLRGEIWMQDECQVHILLLPATTIIHPPIEARRKKKTWKPFPFPLLGSHQSPPRTHPLDYHRSSLPFCFSSRVPIQSIFISPRFSLQLLSFQPNLSISPPPKKTLYSPLSLFTSSLTSSVSLPPPVCHFPSFFFQPLCFWFSLWLLPSQTSSFLYWRISPVPLPPRLPRALTLLALSSLCSRRGPSTDQLGSPAWCLPQPLSLGLSGQFKWFKGVREATSQLFPNEKSWEVGPNTAEIVVGANKDREREKETEREN